MGNSQETSSNNKVINNNQMNKQRFAEATLEIYVFGKYNRLMDILIGKKNDSINNSEKNEFCSPENNQISEISYFKIKKKNNNEEIKQNLLFNDFNEKKNKISTQKNINFKDYLNSFTKNDTQINTNENYTIKNSTFNWEFHFYLKDRYSLEKIKDIKDEINIEDEINEDNLIMNEDIKNEIKKGNVAQSEDIKIEIKKDDSDKRKVIMLIFVESINEIYRVIDIFSEVEEEFCPLFLFIINKDESELDIDKIYENINNYIESKKKKLFIFRNITIKNYIDLEKIEYEDEDSIKSYILDIYLYFIKAWFYYNNLGDDYSFKTYIEKNDLDMILNEIISHNQINQENENKGNGLFNILVLGRSGSGKSTLINLLCGSKRCMEGKGEKITKYVSRYLIKNHNISLYDTPGIAKDFQQIKLLIEELNEHLLKKRNQIHLVFFLVNSYDRDFHDYETEILKILKKNNLLTFFLLTFCPNREVGKEIKENFEKSLRIMFKNFDEKHVYLNEKIKAFPVQLLDDPEKSNKKFGLKDVLDESFNQFKKYIINDDDINKIKIILSKNENNLIKNEKKEEIKDNIFKILNQNENIMYKYIKDIDDLIRHAKDACISSINTYSIECLFLGILGIFTIHFLKKCKKNLILTIAENFRIFNDDEEKNDLIRTNMDKINEFDFEAAIPIYSAYGNYKIIKNLGDFYVNKFTKELNEEGIYGLTKYLVNLINSYNNAIKSLEIIGEKFN